jgi:hypothetical protein
MLDYEKRYDNNPERINYLREFQAKNEAVKALDARPITKKRTRKTKNSRIKNNIPIFKRSIIEFAKSNIASIFFTENSIIANIEQKRGRGRSRKNKLY